MDPVPMAIRPSSSYSDQTFITDLSTELVLCILEFVDMESYVDFACTCKRFAACSSNALRRHQDAFRKYRVTSDLSPDTVPTLLRSAYGTGDPIAAWHVRSFEIWCNRDSWDDWRTFDFEGPPARTVENTPKKWQFQEGEIFEYLLDSVHSPMDNDSVETALREIESGKDGALKMLLLEKLPRLRSVKFITQSHGTGTCLHWMKTTILASIEQACWPPGLRNLRDVAVGIPSETWMDDADSNPSTLVLAVLLRIPGIESIYYKDLVRNGWDDAIDYSFFLPAGHSNVKHIFLDNCDDVSSEFKTALCQASEKLQTFAIRAGDPPNRLEDADSLVSELARCESLHTLMFYGHTRATINGYRCTVYRPEEIRDSELSTFAINVSDIELEAYYERENDWYGNADTNRQHYINFFQRAFPPSLEVLVLWGWLRPGTFLKCDEGESQLEWLEAALIKAIEVRKKAEDEENEDEDEVEDEEGNAGETDSNLIGECEAMPVDDEPGVSQDHVEGLSSNNVEALGDGSGDGPDCVISEVGSDDSYDPLRDDVHYPKLRAVYLEDIERNPNGPYTEKLYFQKLIALGKEAGVDVHVSTNRTKPQHSNEFPQAPDKYDLQTGPWWERRSEIADWVFDVHQGRRVPPGCGKCGSCERCLSVYSKELWDSIAEV